MAAVWNPSKEDIKRLMKLVRVEYTMQTLLQKQDSLTLETFKQGGVYLILLAACQYGATNIVKHFLQNHSNLFDINEQFEYGYTQIWSRPVNYVTLIEDNIGFRDKEKEERKDTLLSFTQRYCDSKNNKDEVIELLEQYGATQ